MTSTSFSPDDAETPRRSVASGSSTTTMSAATTVGTTKSPVDTNHPAFNHDSMVTVRLSEPPSLSVNTNIPPNVMPTRRSIFGPEYTPTTTSATMLANSVSEKYEVEGYASPDSALGTAKNLSEELQESADEESKDAVSEVSQRESIDESEDEVDWEKLQKTEDEHAQDDDNSTAMLLARLEEENNKLASNPKGVKVKVVTQPSVRRPRPPSMAQLRDMVNGPTPVALRYSVLPPPPMTDMEFYVALVKDYQQTAARLPTLLSKKIRQGVPPPLRGVVWQSMAEARDTMLLEHFERLSGESSPYEGIIGKDLGRSFPGVDMFRDPEGDGQRMLGRVLKCFSLYDQKIGYCQGLAFLVGPLLMHMPENQAFCVLVRLMESYDLRSCFLPDLSGLHVRIYQFRELLKLILPDLSARLDELQVDPAYVSQWFLSFFAVTCPLPMLFRIYDVIFAEGASETIMRVALSLMRKNESRILACAELEDAMQLLLSRGLWDCYHYNADEFVDDFVSLSHVVSRERLAQLELNYREAQIATANAARTSDISTAASRFVGRLWAVTSSSSLYTKSTLGALSPGLVAPSRPLSMLRRSTSKQSLASTLNSMETSSASVLSTVSTDATTISRDSSTADDSSIRESTPIATKQNISNNNNATESKALHSQIEDLLTALSELQRDHALLATQLQKEREERDEDRQVVKTFLEGWKKSDPKGQPALDADSSSPEPNTSNELVLLVDGIEERFGEQDVLRNHSAASVETKQQLRDDLARTKERLMIEVSRSEDYNRRMDGLNQETQTLKDQLRDSHAHVRNLHQDKQRLEKQLQMMRGRASADPHSTANGENTGWFSTAANLSIGGYAHGSGSSTPASSGGLRELKLGRSKSTPSSREGLGRRASLMRTQTEPLAPSVSEHESLVLELVQAKTAEAVARQEADEYKQKLESLKKAYGIASTEASSASAASTAANAAMGMFGRLTGAVSDAGGAGSTKSASSAAVIAAPAPTPAASTASSGTGGFWTWRK